MSSVSLSNIPGCENIVLVVNESIAFIKPICKKYDSLQIRREFYNSERIFAKISNEQSFQIIPSDLIKIGRETLLIQRFNTGIAQDIGSKKFMEDIVLVEQNLKVSDFCDSLLSVFAVFDG